MLRRAALFVPLSALTGCFLSSNALEVQLPRGTRSVLLISPDEVFALALSSEDEEVLSAPQKFWSRESYVLSYVCELSRLGLSEGSVPLAAAGSPLPESSQQILRLTERGVEGVDTLPASVADLRLAREGVAASCCPRAILEGTIEAHFGGCEETFCPKTVTRDPARCEARIDPRGCTTKLDAFAEVIVALDPAGRATVTAPSSCAPAQTREGAAASFDCGGADRCRLDIFLEDPEPRFDVELTSVIEVEPADYFALPATAVKYDETLYGYLADLAVLDDRLVVAAYEGARLDDRKTICSPAAPPVVFKILDLETLALLQTTTAPPCTVVLARDPTRVNSFFGASARQDPARADRYEFFLRRFDENGNIADTSTPAEVLLVEGFAEYRARPISMIVKSDPPHPIVVGTGFEHFAPEPREHYQPEIIFTYAGPNDLSLIEQERLRAADGQDVDLTWIIDTGFDGGFAWVEARQDQLRYAGDPVRFAKIDRDPGEGLHDSERHQTIVPSLGEGPSGGLFVVDFFTDRTMRMLVQSPPYETNAGFAAVAPWPVGQSLVIAGGVSQRLLEDGASFHGGLALFSVEARAFLPGSVTLDGGPIRRMLPDRRGRIYALQPWSGRLLRIRPR